MFNFTQASREAIARGGNCEVTFPDNHEQCLKCVHDADGGDMGYYCDHEENGSNNKDLMINDKGDCPWFKEKA